MKTTLLPTSKRTVPHSAAEAPGTKGSACTVPAEQTQRLWAVQGLPYTRL